MSSTQAAGLLSDSMVARLSRVSQMTMGKGWYGTGQALATVDEVDTSYVLNMLRILRTTSRVTGRCMGSHWEPNQLVD